MVAVLRRPDLHPRPRAHGPADLGAALPRLLEGPQDQLLRLPAFEVLVQQAAGGSDAAAPDEQDQGAPSAELTVSLAGVDAWMVRCHFLASHHCMQCAPFCTSVRSNPNSHASRLVTLDARGVDAARRLHRRTQGQLSA